MRSTAKTTRYSGRDKLLADVSDAALEVEEARTRLIRVINIAWVENQVPLTDIANAAGYNRERVRAMTSTQARREAGLIE